MSRKHYPDDLAERNGASSVAERGQARGGTDRRLSCSPSAEHKAGVLRVAAYCRVSTDRSDQANSFESQKRYFDEYIRRQSGWALYSLYSDEGVTGTSAKKRAGFMRMIADARAGCFDLIVTKEISRFARNTLDSIMYTRELKRLGVGVFFVSDNINTLDSDAELRLTIMSSISQEESSRTSERVKWGQKRRMEQGVVFGRSMLGYDVKDGRMTINEEGAEVVRLIFHKFVNEGKGTCVIARELREAGIPTYRGVRDWSGTVVLRILRNEKYCGDLVQKKTYTPDFLSHDKKYNRGQDDLVVIRDHHEPIISRAQFERTSAELERRSGEASRSKRHSARHCFSGRIVCGKCGATCVARYRKRSDGSEYKAWRCGEAVRRGRPKTLSDGTAVGCAGVYLRDEDARAVVRFAIGSLGLDRENTTDGVVLVTGVLGHDTRADGERERLERELTRLRTKEERLVGLYTGGDVTLELFAREKEKLDAEFAAHKAASARLDREQTDAERNARLDCTVREAVGRILDDDGRMDEVIRAVLGRLEVFDDRVEILLCDIPNRLSFFRESLRRSPSENAGADTVLQ